MKCDCVGHLLLAPPVPPTFLPRGSILQRLTCTALYGLLCLLASHWIQPMEGRRRARLGVFIPPAPSLPGCHVLAVSLYWGAVQLLSPGSGNPFSLAPSDLKILMAHESSLWLVLDYCPSFDWFPSPTHTFGVPLVSFPQITQVECTLFPLSCQGPDWYSYQCAFVLTSTEHF